MDAPELKALLEAAARELSSVASELPHDDWDPVTLTVSNEIREAREAVQEAAIACGHASNFGTDGLQPSELLGEACSLRADAVRARDVAEAQLWALQDEHADLLERLRQLSEQQRQRLEEQRAEADLAASREAALVERCGQLDNEVRAMRNDVDLKGQRLTASKALGLSLEINKRKLQRQLEGSLVENDLAREILHLQQSTEDYLQRVSVECGKVDQSLESAHRACTDKIEVLQSEWSEQRAEYEANMTLLENRLHDLQQQYEDRWRATERSARQQVEIRLQQAAESRKTVEQEILRLDEEWEKDAIASRELAEEQDQIMSEARQAALSEMAAKLQERQEEMEEQVVGERRRCQALRNRHLRKIADSQQEVLRYKKNIEELSAGYRRKPQRSTPSCSTPPLSMGRGFGAPYFAHH